MKLKYRPKNRTVNHLCPNCMSTLEVKSGKYICTGDVLNYWRQELEKYDNMKDDEKQIYFNSVSDKEVFSNILSNRESLNCSYSSNLTSIMTDNNMLVPDPLVVSKIELKLGRRLTEEELVEDKAFYRSGSNISLQKVEGFEEFKIPFIRFPEDF